MLNVLPFAVSEKIWDETVGWAGKMVVQYPTELQ